jgi:hypothetical protein
MNNRWSKFAFVVAWFLLLTGVIGGIILAIALKGWYFAIGGIVGGLASFCLFGILGFIAQNLVALNAAAAPEAEDISDLATVQITSRCKEDPYKVRVYVDDQLLGVILSGESATYSKVKLPDGFHTLIVENDDDNTIRNSLDFTAKGTSNVQAFFFVKPDKIDIYPIRTA